VTLRRLVLWRHGETDYNASGRMQGHLDSALTQNGWNQARQAVPAVARFEPQVVVASDLRRATDTATVFSELTGVPLRIDKRLRETHLGEWQGRTGSNVEDEHPGLMRQWQEDPTWAPPGGESRVDVAERAIEVVTELDQEFNATALLTAHGGLIIALVAKLMDLPIEVWPRFSGVANCHWTVLVRRSGQRQWRLAEYNVGLPG
jgi:broad specificity phosphatase PhoE